MRNIVLEMVWVSHYLLFSYDSVALTPIIQYINDENILYFFFFDKISICTH